MATVTHATTALWNTTTGTGTNKNVTATPALNDLIVVIVGSSGLAGGSTAVTDNNSDGNGTYTQVDTNRTGFSTTGVLQIYVRNALIGSASSTVFTAPQTGSSGGGLDVYRISGMTRTGSSAVRSNGGQSTGTAATAPAPVLSLTPLTGNPVITAVCNGSTPGGVTAPGSFTATVTNLGYSTPTTGLDTTYASSGITSATITWGSNSATAFASVAVEFDTSAPPAPPYTGGPQGWSSPAGIRAVYVRTGSAMASLIPPAAVIPPAPPVTPFYPATRPIQAKLPLILRGHKNVKRSKGAPVRNPGSGPVFRQAVQPIRAHVPQNAPRGRIGSNPGGPVPAPPVVAAFRQPNSAIRIRVTPPPRGRVYSHPGAPVHNPGSGPVFTKAVRPAAARLPVPFLKGRVSSNKVTPPHNPGAGPAFRQATQPARGRIPQNAPRGRMAALWGIPVATVIPVTPFYPATSPAGIRHTLPGRGRIVSGKGAPLHNPGAGPKFTQKTFPARARITLPPRGRTGSNPGGLVITPPAIVPSFHRQGAIQGKSKLPRRGICRTTVFLPVQLNPQAGPVFTQATQPVRARTPLPPRGRTGSNKGGPVQNPVPPAVAPFRQQSSPSRIRPALPPRGRVNFNPGAPVHNPGAGPVFRQRENLPLVQPLPRRGTCRAIRFYPLIAPPPFVAAAAIPLPGPVRAQPGQFLKGRVSGSKGAPLQNPGPGPVFRQATPPARIRPQMPPRGRVGSNPGTSFIPASSPGISSGQPAGVRVIYQYTGRVSSTPAYTAPPQPPPPPTVAPFRQRTFTRAQLPQPRRGTCRAIRFYLLPPEPGTGPVFRQAVRPAQARFPLPSRGRIGSNPGTLPPPPPVPAKIYPLQGPARTRITLPPRGRIASGKGAPLRNPNPGPVFRQAVRPIRGIIPQNAPRGRTGSNPGGPVENIPFRQIRITLGQPYTSWGTGGPYTSWLPGQPWTGWETDGPD